MEINYMNAYGEDLRVRAIEYVESGHRYKEAVAIYGVSERTICNWVKLKNNTGNLKARAVPRCPHKLQDEELFAYVKANQDAYLREIAEHFGCCAAAVHKALKRLGITYKKTPFIAGKKQRATKTLHRFCKSVSIK
jgi:transposase